MHLSGRHKDKSITERRQNVPSWSHHIEAIQCQMPWLKISSEGYEEKGWRKGVENSWVNCVRCYSSSFKSETPPLKARFDHATWASRELKGKPAVLLIYLKNLHRQRSKIKKIIITLFFARFTLDESEISRWRVLSSWLYHQYRDTEVTHGKS